MRIVVLVSIPISNVWLKSAPGWEILLIAETQVPPDGLDMYANLKIHVPFSPLLSDYVGTIAQVLEVLRHQREVGVKSRWLLIIYYEVLQVVNIWLSSYFRNFIRQILRALHKLIPHMLNFMCHLGYDNKPNLHSTRPMSHIFDFRENRMTTTELAFARCKMSLYWIARMLTRMTMNSHVHTFQLYCYLWDFLNEHSSPQILPKIRYVTQNHGG